MERSYELDGALVTKVTTTSEYDDFGNPTRIVVNTHDSGVKTTVNTYTNDTGKWHLGRLTRAEVTSATATESSTRTSAFAYDAVTGLLTQEVIEPDRPALRLVTDYTHDAFGNRVSVSVSVRGRRARAHHHDRL